MRIDRALLQEVASLLAAVQPIVGDDHWKHRAAEVVAYLEGLPQEGAEGITILHVRDPDSECAVELYDQDGKPIKVEVSEVDVDPGRGYEVEDWDENLQWAMQSLPEGSELQHAVLEAYGDPPRGGRDYIVGWREKHEADR